MGFKKVTNIQQLDFQINRILTYGNKACDEREVLSAAQQIVDLNSWFDVWYELGIKAESETRFLHAAYYFRLAEFFLLDTNPDKKNMYNKSIENYLRIIGTDSSVEITAVPYGSGGFKTHIYRQENSKASIVLFGGYDSFIEEFYLAIKEIADAGYTVYAFEGPGQGASLKQGLHFQSDWEKPVAAVLDYFNLNDVTVLGISWGGYLALRAAAFEKRIQKVIAYDILYDGFDCMIHPFPFLARGLLKLLFIFKQRRLINAILGYAMNKQLVLNWAVSHGQYITGTKSPYEFYEHLKKHSLKGIEKQIICDVLLLAGEKDHYIPLPHYHILMKKLTKARSLEGRIFTKPEGGEQHCQVGNHRIAVDYIINWLNK